MSNLPAGKRLKLWRVERDLHQRDVAKMLRVSVMTVCYLERGTRRPSEKLAKTIKRVTKGAIQVTEWNDE